MRKATEESLAVKNKSLAVKNKSLIFFYTSEEAAAKESLVVKNKSLIFFYKFNINYATNKYDAVLINGAKITQLDYAVGESSLLLDNSKSHYLELPAFTPSSNGLTIAY